MTSPRGGFDRRHDELSEEIESHISMAIAERTARGESLESATAAVRREFGNRDVVRAATRDEQGSVWIEHVTRDIRYAMRKLYLAPAFTAVAVLSLAIGIGATITMYAVVDAADIRPLPYPNADRLVDAEQTMRATTPDNHTGRTFGAGVSLVTFANWRSGSHSFDAMTLVSEGGLNWLHEDEAEQLRLPSVEPEFFEMLGAVPVVGRRIAASDTAANAPPVLVLSHSFWESRFGGDPKVIGTTLRLSEKEDLSAPREEYTIIGVMPAKIDYPGAVQGWIARRTSIAAPSGNAPTMQGYAHVLARLRPGQSVEAASLELSAVDHRAPQQQSTPGSEHGVRVRPLRQKTQESGSKSGFTIDSPKGRAVRLGVVLFVLLIAMTNVGNLLLARAAARDHEMAVRAALGASRGRLALQLLVEGSCIALLGGALGVLLATWGTRITGSMGDFALEGIVPLVDGRVLLFALVLTIVVALGVSLIPSLSLRGSAVWSGLSATRHISVGRARARLQGLMLVGQIAAALTLLTGAALLGKELLRLRSQGYDYDPANLIWIPNAQLIRGQSASDAQQFRDGVLTGLSRVPGVLSVSELEVCGCGGFFPAGQKSKMSSNFMSALAVNPGFLKSLRIPLRSGRDFTDADFAAAAPIAIVSSAAAQSFWPGQNPIGKQVVVPPGFHRRGEPAPDTLYLTVVGVMGDPNFMASLGPPPPTVIRPHTTANGFALYMVRVTQDSAATLAAIRRTLMSLRGAPLARDSYGSAEKFVIDKRLAEQRITTRSMIAFAVVAILLAALGIHGLVAYSVAQRTREIGIRMALGAESARVLLLVSQRSLTLAAAGIVIGLAGSVAISRVLSAILYGTSPTDPVVYAGSALALGGIVFLATYLPARRAIRVDPMTALRVD